ncbi:acid-sensing ion channel 1C-like [Asterias amurensis]|uniref:acid-sensing ion channel 1C-like n=1 Tax=Asterias amurensis TaxID=7602 RepID=UPI003AB283F2
MLSDSLSTICSRPMSPGKVTPMAIEDGDGGGSDGTGQRGRKPHDDLQQSRLMVMVGTRLENSGAHGIPNIKRAESTRRRLAWTLLFLAGLGMFVYQGYELINKYYSWPINVNVEVRDLRTAQFPAVTWCNLNPIRKDALDDISDLCELIGGQNPDCMSSSGPTEFPLVDDGYDDWETDNISYSAEDEDDKVLQQVTGIVGALPYEERSTTGHKLQRMLLKCTFQKSRCSPKNFTTFYNFRYGNCFTFNSGHNGTRNLNVTKSGPAYGLTMELYIEQDQYITDVETGAGVRFMVHNQTDMPFPEDKGSNVAPGTETFIGMHRVLINRLPDPYGRCVTEFSRDNIFKDKFRHLHYTREACEKDCYFEKVLSECGCADVRYRYDDWEKACNSTEDGDCLERVENSFTSGQLKCSYCQYSCNDTVFELTHSNSHWPNRNYENTVIDNIQKVSKDFEDLIANNSNFVRENVLRVNIYYDSLDYEDIYQTEAYTLSTLASDLGGQVGLWIGVSVLTLCEILEIVMDVALLVFHSCQAGRRKR